MEQQEPRKSFVKNLYEFCKHIVLNEVVLEELKKHSNWEYVKEAMKFKDEMARKAFIFLEFTRERSTCDQMVEILRKSGQEEAAEQLKGFNTSPPFMDITYDIELKIIPATVLRSGASKWFVMENTPERGMCIIINNVKKELYKESLRFRNIFEQLSFKVEEWYDMSANEIENRLKKLSKDDRLKKDNALIVMIISHGHDEKVIGFDDKDLRISTIVDIFSEDNCKAMQRKPKLFFFNCCRNKLLEVPVIARHEHNRIVIELETVGENWINKNRYTLICFACAEADRSWFEPNKFTYFGQALSHCIAQYACDKSVQQIMNLTCERVEQLLYNAKDYGIQVSPEIRLCKMTRELYLNPGLPINPNKKYNPIKPVGIIEDTKHASIPEKRAHEDSKLKESIPEKSTSKKSKSEKNAPEKSAPQNFTDHEMSAKPDNELIKKSLKETNFYYLPPMEITNEIELNVNPLNVLRTEKIEMSFIEPNTKGICIIINNVSNKLHKESKRFKNVFEQLKFYVEEYYDISANEMIERLKNFALDKRLEEDISLVVMIISHGYNEKVVDSNGEELQISTIVDIFSEDNCKAMHKLFFFNCCHNNSQKSTVLTTRDHSLNNKIDVRLEPVDQNGINKNKYTLICFAYAEAYNSWFGQNEFTYFGQALSHCIAQYAYHKNVQQIMNLTCETAEQLLIKSQKENIRLCKIFRELFLNLSLPIEDSSTTISRSEIEDFNVASMANSFSQITPEIKEKFKHEIELFEQLNNSVIMQKQLLFNDPRSLNTDSNNASMNELGEKIGSGGFGDVFKDKDNNNLCIKIVPIKNLNIEERLKLKREVDIMMKLQSEYVVKYHNCYIKNVYLCIKMERCYLNLRSIIDIKRKEFSREKYQPMEKLEFYITCELFEEILECVNYLHSQKIIHRDLNPANILITDKGTKGRFIKIGDFGLAKYHELKSQSMKHTTDVGTIEYVAPEVRSGRNYGIKADYFSIGVTMSEMFEIEIPMLNYPEILDQEFLLKPNYNNMKKMLKNLLNDDIVFRPNCTQSKQIMTTWAIKLNNLTNDIEFINLKKELLSDITIEESFHKFFLMKKLRI